MSFVNFFKGLKADYNPELHSNGIYQCTDYDCDGLVYLFGRALNIPLEKTDLFSGVSGKINKADITFLSPSGTEADIANVFFVNPNHGGARIGLISAASDKTGGGVTTLHSMNAFRPTLQPIVTAS